MMRGIVSICSLISVVLFPWQIAALIALGAAFVEPLVPFAMGLLIDTLYFMPQGVKLPLFTLGGALVSLVASVVHSRLRTSTIDA
jgi:hypothetical protein